MTTPFSSAAAVATSTLHANMGEPALYVVPPAAGVPVTVIRAVIDAEIQVPGFEVAQRSPGLRWEIQQLLVPERPRPGIDYLVFNGHTHQIRDVEARPDWWVLDMSEG